MPVASVEASALAADPSLQRVPRLAKKLRLTPHLVFCRDSRHGLLVCGQAGWGIPGCVHSSIGRDTCVRVVLHATCWLCLFLGEPRHGAASRGGAWDDGCTGEGCRPSLTPLTRGVEEHRGAHGILVHILAIT